MTATPPFNSHFLKGAAVILYRYCPHLEVLLIHRSSNLKAYPDYWAFPGGREDPDDLNFSDTALRELFEETSLSLLPVDHQIEKQCLQWQKDLNAGILSWSEIRTHLGYSELNNPLLFIGWRVAPPIHSVRFEAAYFCTEYTQTRQYHISAEAQKAQWWKPQALINAWEQGAALIPPPVMSVLRTLVPVSQVDKSTYKALKALANNRTLLYHDMEIHPAVEMLPLRTPTLEPATHTNTYFVGKESFVIIDPASPYTDEQICLRERIQARIHQGHKPIAVLLTHHHIDHVGAAADLQQHFQLPIMAHALTQKRLQEMRYPLTIDRCIEEGDCWLLQSGTKQLHLEAIFTPGHAPGHLCFIEKSQRFGIVGDMVAGIGSIVIQHPKDCETPDGDMKSYLESLERLKSLALHRAFPAHGPMITQPEITFTAYIQHRLAREAQILLHLNVIPCSISDLRSKVYPDLDITLYSFAEDALRAHLVKLEDENQVYQENQGFYSKR